MTTYQKQTYPLHSSRENCFSQDMYRQLQATQKMLLLYIFKRKWEMKETKGRL